jgi:hypothetical protein
MINDPNCKTCDGSGIITGSIAVPECCLNFTDAGSCCNNPIAVQEQIQERCPECEAYEDAIKDQIK